MSAALADVVVVGGGIVGAATAYYLGRAGVRCVVVEKDSVGSHASGFAFGSLTALTGTVTLGPTFEVAREGIRLHRELAASLPEETGINTGYRIRPSMSPAFTPDEAEAAKGKLPWMREQRGYSARWVDGHEARSIEPRLSPEVVGGLYVEGEADLDPYRSVLALTHAAEKLGAEFRHGRVTGLRRSGGAVSAVELENGSISCGQVVLAMGPWTGEAGAWLGLSVPVRPLKGQILRLRAPGRPLACALSSGGCYVSSKPDGLVWAGTTVEEAGFDENTTPAARGEIMARLLKMLPSSSDAELVQQTACLRPVSGDGLMVLGRAPGWDGVFVATGGGRQGIILGPAMGLLTAEMLTGGATSVPIDTFDPGRFTA